MADLSGYNWSGDPRETFNQPELNVEPDDEASVLGDLALAVPRGIVGAGQDAYGLLDTIAFDALPDWTENPLGESETVAGGLLEGITNFAAGFIPILGQVSKVGKLGKFGRYAVAGALTDFTVFDGNEARLSNLLRDYAGLEDPVTEFLAADEDDPEIVGRLKNALEGFGIGSAVDLLVLSVRGVKKYNRKIAEGKSKEVAAREVASEIKAEEFQAAYETAQVKEEVPTTRAAYGDVPEDNVELDIAQTAAADQFTDPAMRAAALNNRKRGVESIEARLNFEYRRGLETAKNSAADTSGRAKDIPLFQSKEELEIAVAFARTIDPVLLSDVGLSVRKEIDGAAGTYDFVRSLITLSKKASDTNAPERTIIHEMWHSLSRYVEPKYIEALKREYIREVNTRIQATDRFGTVDNPAGPGSFLRRLKGAQGGAQNTRMADYRFVNLDEWFAEVMTDKSLKHLDDLSKFKDKDAGAVITFVRQVWDKLTGYLRSIGGYSSSEELFNKFIAREIKPVIHNKMGLVDTGGTIRFMPEAGETLVHAQLRSIGVDPTVITPDEIQKAIAVRTRQFENAGIDPAVNPRKLNEAELAITALSEKGLNLRDVRDSRDAALLARTAEMLLPVKKAQTMEDVWAQAKEWADDTGQDPQKLMLELQGLGQEAGLLVRKMSVARAVYKQHLTTATQQWREVRSKGGTPEQIAEAITRFQNLIPLQKALQDVRSNFGLGLGSLGHDLGNSIITREMAEKMILDAGGEANVHNMLDALADAFEHGGVGAASAIAKDTLGKKFWNVSYEVWIQGLISHPRSIVVSGTSASTGTIYRPLEMLMGGGMQSLRMGRSSEAVHAAAAQMANLWEAIPAAWKAAKSSWYTEKNRLAGAGMLDNDRRAITAERLGLTDSPYAAMIDTIGRIVRTPGRMLAAQDEFFGTLTYRAIVKERLETQMLAEYGSKGLPREEALAAATEQLDKMVVDGMAYSRGSLYQKAFADAKAANPGGNAAMWKQAAQEHVAQNFDPKLGALAEYAIKTTQRDVTMTAPLSIHSQNPLSSSAARLQGLVESTPILKLFAPFIRTPTNIAIWGTQRFDVVGFGKALALQTFPDSMPKTLGAKHRFVQDIMSQDPIRKAEALGRLMTGVAVTSSIASLAYNGSVTGRGPKDPNLRKILEASGWQPYSVKIGNTYYSYARLDPLATMLGTIADSMEWSKWAPEEDRGEAATLAWGFAVGMANNVTNKTYFTGLMRLTEVLSDPANAVEKTARSYAGSAVPNLLASLVPSLGDDDYMREARTYTDSILRKVPGYSDSLAPRRNILGEPVAWNRVLGDEVGGDFASIFSPIAASAVSDDLIWKELSTLERAFEAPRRSRNGLDLTTFSKQNGQDAYDRWQELAGTTPIRGLKLRDALRKLIKSPEYQRLPAESSWEAQSPRVFEIKNLLESYRAAAFQKVLKEYPDLAKEDLRIYLTRRELKRGVDRRNPLEPR